MKVNRCRCPCISFAPGGIPSFSIQRSGLYSLASVPHSAAERFTDSAGTQMYVPLPTVMWSTSFPERVRTGLLSGITSSFVAYLHQSASVSYTVKTGRGSLPCDGNQVQEDTYEAFRVPLHRDKGGCLQVGRMLVRHQTQEAPLVVCLVCPGFSRVQSMPTGRPKPLPVSHTCVTWLH